MTRVSPRRCTKLVRGRYKGIKVSRVRDVERSGRGEGWGGGTPASPARYAESEYVLHQHSNDPTIQRGTIEIYACV